MGLGIRAQHLMARAATAGALFTCLAIVVGVGRMGSVNIPDPAPTAFAPTPPAWTMSLAAIDTPAPTPSVAAPVAPIAPVPPPEMSSPLSAKAEELPPPILVSDMTSAAVYASEGRLPEPEADVVGLWAPDASSCSLRSFRQGLLPTIINMQGAWAGETACLFKNRRQTDTGWRVLAQCSSGGAHWTTQVQLTLKGDRLIWDSKRGRQVYTRCGTDLRMAEAP